MLFLFLVLFFFFSSRRRHTRCSRDWSSDVCSSDLIDLNNSEGFVQPTPSGRICKGTPVQPPFSLRCTELTRTFNCTQKWGVKLAGDGEDTSRLAKNPLRKATSPCPAKKRI